MTYGKLEVFGSVDGRVVQTDVVVNASSCL
uniref:CooT family nickel-binding protein n=1 Tax=Ascaris lumbricoides TaxID=6252 RepID=A0A0M3IXR2_ASCLU